MNKQELENTSALNSGSGWKPYAEICMVVWIATCQIRQASNWKTVTR